MPPYPVICGRPDLYQRYDPYGYRLWPQLRKAETYVRSRPRRFEVVSNRQGFRSGRDFLELEAEATQARIAELYASADHRVQLDEVARVVGWQHLPAPAGRRRTSSGGWIEITCKMLRVAVSLDTPACTQVPIRRRLHSSRDRSVPE
jgi:hypothetical protein